MDDKDSARLLGLLRVAVGTGLFLMPKTTGRMWTGRELDDYPNKMMVRAIGARDAAIGLGLLMSVDEDRARTWLQAGAVSDATDALGTLGSFGELPGLRRFLLLATEVAAAYLGFSLAERID